MSSSSTTLIPMIPDIKAYRERLFNLAEHPMEMSITNFEAIWPYIDNIWCRREVRTYPDHTHSYYRCRRGRKEWTPVLKDKSTNRQRSIRQGKQCAVTFKATRYNEASVIILERIGGWTEHNHTLEEADALKRNSMLRGIAASEMSKNYSAATIAKALHGGRVGTNIEDAGGAFLTRMDVHNAGQAWKTANPDDRVTESRLPPYVQLSEAVEWLNGKGYQCSQLKVSRKNARDSEGVVFGWPERITKL
ncbi:MAG: 2,5-diamino-6-(ribosylamino)-4(3H)-pyrimidinone 5'-phosphate reductase [Pleopsidium flavum]|nr:MAG: 2,5-diamino-6-(ribosylamino)-4(3H)-pyrimidinone 5'-phosphate reductase [Pleopsidium flavum]